MDLPKKVLPGNAKSVAKWLKDNFLLVGNVGIIRKMPHNKPFQPTNPARCAVLAAEFCVR